MNIYKRHRFPPEIIQYATWLYHRFNLSHRDIEDLLSKRSIQVSYEAIRLWCNKFGNGQVLWTLLQFAMGLPLTTSFFRTQFFVMSPRG